MGNIASPAFRELYRLKAEALALAYPDFPKHAIPKPKFSDATANGLTKCVMEYIRLKGGYANRVNTMGVQRGGKWTRSSTAKGTPDIQGIINGKSIQIEIKVGKDRLSEAQIKQAEKITAAGGVFYCARNFEDFFNWFNETFK